MTLTALERCPHRASFSVKFMKFIFILRKETLKADKASHNENLKLSEKDFPTSIEFMPFHSDTKSYLYIT